MLFVQEEGCLSPDYRQWADACLHGGATIVELNVFDLPSRHRPRTDAYNMAVYTRGGVLRYRLRSWGGALPAQSAYLELPNVLPLGQLHDRGPREPGVLRLLRLGRPDPIKWSDWEVGFAAALARHRPSVRVELTLVGAPAGVMVPSDLPHNLKVISTEYVQDIALVYAAHDVYVHFSRIGETFGNTFAEAQRAGLFVVGAFDPRWDCAPTEYLDPRLSLLGTRRWLRHHVDVVWGRIEEHLAGQVAPKSEPVGLTSSEYLRRITAGRPTSMRRMPGPFEAAMELAEQTRRLHGVPVGALAPAWEVLRGLRRLAGERMHMARG